MCYGLFTNIKFGWYLSFLPSFFAFRVSCAIKLLMSLPIAMFTPTAATALDVELGGWNLATNPS